MSKHAAMADIDIALRIFIKFRAGVGTAGRRARLPAE
jgi:hypothetical protein